MIDEPPMNLRVKFREHFRRIDAVGTANVGLESANSFSFKLAYPDCQPLLLRAQIGLTLKENEALPLPPFTKEFFEEVTVFTVELLTACCTMKVFTEAENHIDELKNLLYCMRCGQRLPQRFADRPSMVLLTINADELLQWLTNTVKLEVNPLEAVLWGATMQEDLLAMREAFIDALTVGQLKVRWLEDSLPGNFKGEPYTSESPNKS